MFILYGCGVILDKAYPREITKDMNFWAFQIMISISLIAFYFRSHYMAFARAARRRQERRVAGVQCCTHVPHGKGKQLEFKLAVVI